MRKLIMCSAVLVVIAAMGCEQKNDSRTSTAVQSRPVASRASPDATDAPTGVVALLQPALESFCAVDLDGAASIFTEDHECQLAVTGSMPIAGRDGQKSMWEKVQLAFPDVNVSASTVLDAGTFWILEGVITGTQQGTFMGQAPSMKKVGTHFAMFNWVEGDKIKKSFVCGNPKTVLDQIQAASGKGPPVPTPPARPRLINGPGSHAHIQHVRAFFQAFQSGDWADLDKMVRPDITVFAFGDGKKFKGSEALLAVLSDEHSAFAGQVEIEEIVAVGSYVAALVKISGQLRHDHGPLKAGRPFTERGIDIFRFQDGRIKVWRNYRNLYDLIEQLSEPIKPTPASGT